MNDDFTNAIVESMKKFHPAIKAILLKGSRINNNSVDYWSDYDIIVVLDENKKPSEELLLKSIRKLGKIYGTESLIKSDHIVLRSVVEFHHNIHLLDLSICTMEKWDSIESKSAFFQIIFGEINQPQNIDVDEKVGSLENYRGNINATWFKFFQTIKKIARNDYLVGFHLLLDILREILVIKMMLRDIEYDTTIHRYGYGEELPEVFCFDASCYNKKIEILDYIGRVAFEYDSLLSGNLADYEKQYDHVLKYIQESKKYLISN